MVGPEIVDTDGGSTLRVRVAPGAKRERITGVLGDALKVAVRQPPERGRANRSVCRLVAEALHLAPRAASVLRGATSKNKVLIFVGIDAATLRARVAALLATLAD